MIHADERAAVFFRKCDRDFSRRRVKVGKPAEAHLFVLLQFQVMAAGIKIAAPPQVDAPARMRVNRRHIAQPLAQGSGTGEGAVGQFERGLDEDFNRNSGHKISFG